MSSGHPPNHLTSIPNSFPPSLPLSPSPPLPPSLRSGRGYGRNLLLIASLQGLALIIHEWKAIPSTG